MIQLSAEQRAQILSTGRDIAFDRVWVAADPSSGRFDREVDLYLVVRIGLGRTVSTNTLRRFQEAVERIVPGATVGVDGVDALDGVGDSKDLEVLLHMVELTDCLTDRDEGLWCVTTASDYPPQNCRLVGHRVQRESRTHRIYGFQPDTSQLGMLLGSRLRTAHQRSCVGFRMPVLRQ